MSKAQENIIALVSVLLALVVAGSTLIYGYGALGNRVDTVEKQPDQKAESFFSTPST